MLSREQTAIETAAYEAWCRENGWAYSPAGEGAWLEAKGGAYVAPDEEE